MTYNDTATKLGLIQSCEMKCGFNFGDISGNTNLMYEFTAKINRAQDRFCFLAASADGRWQFADDNDTNLYIATTNIVSGQRDYSFSLDHLAIEKVLIKSASTGNWSVISPIDQNDPDSSTYLENNSSNTGTPSQYDKRGSSIILQPSPNYSLSSALKVYYQKGPNLFVYTDTTKSPGFASIFHDYLALHASAHYSLEKGLTRTKDFFELLDRQEASIKEYYSERNRDEKIGLRVTLESANDGR